MLLTLRGAPTIYAGDEQGFVGDGGDQDAREDMFGSKVAVYNNNQLLGTEATTATPRYDRNHPLFREMATLAKLRTAHPALRRGDTTVRVADDKPGLFAVSRRDAASGERVLIAFNTSSAPITRSIAIRPDVTGFTRLVGDCPAAPDAPGSVRLTLPAFGYVVCQARTQP
jgi:glycosidase